MAQGQGYLETLFHREEERSYPALPLNSRACVSCLGWGSETAPNRSLEESRDHFLAKSEMERSTASLRSHARPQKGTRGT